MSFGSWAFSFGPFASDPWPFSKVLKFTAQSGYDGIELNGFRPHPHPDEFNTPAKCAELKQEIEGLGLGISAYAPDFREVPPAIVETDAYLTAVEKCVLFCERLGITTLRVDTVSPPDVLAPDEYEQRFACLANTWGAAAKVTGGAGVTLVWEFEPGFWLNKPSEVKRMAEATQNENFKLLFDTSHAYMGSVIGARHTGAKETLAGGVPAYAEMIKEFVGHLHLIDSDGTLHDNETSTHTPFGQGQVDFQAALAPLAPLVKSMPWWCADFCFCAETETAAKDAVTIMRKLAESIQ